MSEQEQTFLKKLKSLIITWASVTASGIIISMILFYLNANGRIEAVEHQQRMKVNTYDFENYKELQLIRESYLYETLETIKSDVKELKKEIK